MWQAWRGSLLPGAGAASRDEWGSPVTGPGVHHMAWPADMQCRRCAIVHHPRWPVCLKISPEIQNQIPSPPLTSRPLTLPPLTSPPITSPHLALATPKGHSSGSFCSVAGTNLRKHTKLQESARVSQKCSVSLSSSANRAPLSYSIGSVHPGCLLAGCPLTGAYNDIGFLRQAPLMPLGNTCLATPLPSYPGI